jgi:hypothetical protein
MMAFLKTCFVEPIREMPHPMWQKTMICIGRILFACGIWMMVVGVALSLLYVAL